MQIFFADECYELRENLITIIGTKNKNDAFTLEQTYKFINEIKDATNAIDCMNIFLQAEAEELDQCIDIMDNLPAEYQSLFTWYQEYNSTFKVSDSLTYWAQTV